MDDQTNMDILTTYQIYLVKQMDMLFSMLAMIGMLQTNDLRMRANIKEMDEKYRYNYQEFLVNLEKIVSPETSGDPEGAAKEVAKELTKDNGKVKKQSKKTKPKKTN